MHKSTLREVSKFASGLVLGDFLCGLWLYAGGYLPMTFWGIMFNEQRVVGWLIFDALLFGLLIHYGWKMGDRVRTDSERTFHKIAGVLFTLVALLHLSRIFFGWNFMIGSWNAPYWLNGLGTVVTAFLAWASFSLSSQERR